MINTLSGVSFLIANSNAYQDGCVAFMEGLNRFDPQYEGGFNAFMKTHLRQFYMKRQMGQFDHSAAADKSLEEVDGSGQKVEDMVADAAVDIEGAQIDRDSRQRLWDSVLSLTPSQGRVLYRHFHDGQNLVRVAAEMGITHKAVRNLRDRGLKNLKKSLKGVPF